MTDTGTQTQPGATTQGNGKREMAPREVFYDIETIDGDLPERTYSGGGGGHSPLEENLTKIVNDPTKHSPTPEGKPRWNVIGKYGKSTAATAAKNVLQQRHGRSVNVEGFAFATRRFPAESNDAGKTGLFVKYEPGSIVEGAKAQHDQAEKDRTERLAKAKAEREAAAAAEKPSGGSASGSETAAETKAATQAAGSGSGKDTVSDVQAKAAAKRQEKAAQ